MAFTARAIVDRTNAAVATIISPGNAESSAESISAMLASHAIAKGLFATEMLSRFLLANSVARAVIGAK